MVANQKAFDEAILLSRTRLKLSDPNLTYGAVEKVTVCTSTRAYERPWSINGSFATVYKFRAQNGEQKALRCFRVAISPEIKDRYIQLGDYFGTYLKDVTVGFRYYDEGIWVDDTRQGVQQRIPHAVILMDWIEGDTLLAQVDKLCRNGDRKGLESLCQQWLQLLSIMRRAHMAHGDLSGSNVLVKSDGNLVLVDYDSVYIPAFCGLAPYVCGQADYQHPDMQRRPFDEHMDDFSGYVIFIALRALQNCPQLWESYAPRGKSGQLLEANLLFTQKDFRDPEQSNLFSDLVHVPDPLLQYAVQALRKACQQPIDQIQFPPLDDEYRTIAGEWHLLSQHNKERCRQITRCLLGYAIHHQLTHDIVLFAQRLEQDCSSPLPEKTLRDAVRAAKQQFIEQFYPQNITAQTDGLGNVRVFWQWPAEELVQFAVIAWRTDRAPTFADELGTYLYQPITRQRYREQGCFQFQVPAVASIYVQVYFAIPDSPVSSSRMTWIYSKNNERATHCQVIHRGVSVLNAY